MSRAAWLKERFEAAVSQGIGEWIDASNDRELGNGVFAWTKDPEVRLFENGLTYGGSAGLKLRYEDITGVDLLTLPGLLRAQKAPDKPVELTVKTLTGRHSIQVHLYLYSPLSSTLNTLAEEAQERR
jgi:hypothetical protein